MYDVPVVELRLLRDLPGEGERELGQEDGDLQQDQGSGLLRILRQERLRRLPASLQDQKSVCGPLPARSASAGSSVREKSGQSLVL